MSNYNRVILIGNLTRDPELAYTLDQTPVVNFGLAVNRRWKDRNGQQCEDVCFVECVSYGPRGYPVHKYCNKGSSVLVEGELRYQSWEKDGKKKSRHIVQVRSVQFLTPKREGDSNGQADS